MSEPNGIGIIYEDDEILVLDKPAGITVNRSETTKELTVQDWTEKKLGIANQKLQVGEDTEKISDYTSDAYFQQAYIDRGGIVHRLDKETSGILIIAKNPHSLKELLRQFKNREVQKTYLALVHGNLVPKEGEINVPVDRLPWNRRQFGIVPGGRESVTLYKVLESKYVVVNKKTIEPVSLVELAPKTGRTHQIRVHMKYSNHPIFSDFLYAGRKTSARDRKLLNRVFLHAAKISFHHPKSGKEMRFTSPLPKELQEFISQYLVEEK